MATDVKGKAMKKLATKKRKYAYANTERAAAVAATVERAERGGARSGVCHCRSTFTSTEGSY